ncbi:MAG TPA: hypothetical protein VGF15_01570 [Solirubrobacteraceae bacterium]
MDSISSSSGAELPGILSELGTGAHLISERDTIDALLESSNRTSVAVRRSFVQDRQAEDRPAPGSLAALVRGGRRSTFDQYLLLLAWAGGPESTLCLDSRVWARMLGLPMTDASRRTISRNWKILSGLRLVSIRRAGRQISATALCEDGSGGPYVHPEEDHEPSLQLPYSYWRERYHKRLTVPGKAVLLIALTLGDWFALPTRRGPLWYGLSRSTLERGFKNAYDCAALGTRYSLKEAPLAPAGYTKENHYILLAPFGPRGIIAKTAPPNYNTRWPRPKRMPRKRPKRRRASNRAEES